ncbi:MAG: acetyl-CoA carboxylase carboxyltransferase subunit alpha [Verrucomicrobiota bacterium]
MTKSNNYLEFEKEIGQLEEKISELYEFSREHDVDVSHGIQILEQRVDEARARLFANLSAWQRVQLARHPDRPYPRDYIERLCTNVQELHGDRRFADDKAMFAGFATFREQPVVVIGTQKGRDLKENVLYNFGSAHPEGYRKALRVMQLAHKAGLPIITLIDTPGAYPGIGAEQRHIGEAIAVNLREMMRLRVPIVCVVTGEGGSGGALGIGVGNRVLVMENAYYSVITPEGCAAILWRDGERAPEAAEALKLTARDLLEHGLVDDVVTEPEGGAHRDCDNAAILLGDAIEKQLNELSALSGDELLRDRYDRFRGLGVVTEN